MSDLRESGATGYQSGYTPIAMSHYNPVSTNSVDSAPPVIIMCLAFCSGFVIMSVELLGGRILAPWFGSSIHVWGSIITVFMLSLSIGYLLGGRLSLHKPNLGMFGSFFLLAAIALLPTIYFGDPLMDWLFDQITDPRYGSLTVSGLLFFLPTAILGAIAPYSVRLLVTDEEHSGRIAGKLYFVSTMGSALGTLATSFYLVLWFEINEILVTLTLVLFISGLIAWTTHMMSGTRS